MSAGGLRSQLAVARGRRVGTLCDMPAFIQVDSLPWGDCPRPSPEEPVTDPYAVPPPDLDQIADLMRRVEAHHDTTGWHEHADPWLYLIYDPHDVVTAVALHQVTPPVGQFITNDRYAACPILDPRLFAYSGTDGEMAVMPLYRFAMNAGFADLDLMKELAPQSVPEMIAFRKALRMPGVIGFLFLDEANCLRDLAEVPRADHIRHHVSVQEARLLVMVDAADRTHRVIHWRNDSVETNLTADLTGGVIECLRVLMDTAADRLPTTPDQFKTRYTALRSAD